VKILKGDISMLNKRIIIGLFVLLLIQSFIVSCSNKINMGDNLPQSSKPVIASTPDDFSFIIMADRTARERGKVFKEAVDKVKLLSPSFVINVGDIIEGYSDPVTTREEWDEVDKITSRLKVPFYYVPGNHDIADTGALKEWQKRIGSTYYNFKYKNALFIVLNSEAYRSAFDPDKKIEGYEILGKQNEWLKEVLQKNMDVKWTFIFLHNPVWDYEDGIPPGWTEVEDMLVDRPYTVFAGHFHEYTRETRNNRDYITLATTGGDSELKGIDYGQFDHITMVNMKNNEPIIANLMLSGIYGKNIRDREWRDLFNSISRNITIEPESHTGNIFTNGLIKIHVKNTGDRNLSIKTETIPNGDVTVIIRPEIVDLKPASEEIIELESRSDKPLFYGSIKPINFVLTHYIEKPSGETADLKLKYAVYPQTNFLCPSPAEKITIDGDWNEWKELPFSIVNNSPEEKTTSSEPPLRFTVAADSEYLYLAAHIIDDEVYFSKDKNNYEQDGLIIHLDARKDPERSQNKSVTEVMSSGETNKMLVTITGLVESKAEHAFIGKLPENSRMKGIKTDDGYSLEIAIPMSYMNNMQGETCKAFRLNLGIWDVDPSKSSSIVQGMWRPDRYGEDAIPGTGTFIIEK
jgi:hypothetical protein